MTDIGTPAWRLTADCIWNSFRSSGKRHLILTGDRRKGKTTLLRQLFSGQTGDPASALPFPGITTWAQPGKAVYLRENQTGRTAQIGRFDPNLPGPSNRMQPVAEGFKELGLPALRRCADSGEEWAVIDEIGYLETACPDYCAEILTLMEKKKLAAAVRKQELPFLTKLCRRPDVFLVDLDNPFGEVGCVIMASGLGRRFGGNKLLAKFGEKPLVQWALDATEGIFARRVAVTRHREVEQLCRSQGIDVILHDLPDRSDTIRLGLDALCEARPSLSGCLFCPADQPLLHRETVASLALLAADQPDCIWRPSWQEQAGAPVLFPRSLFEELCSLPQGRGGNWIIRRRPELVRLLSVRNPWELEDVDRPQDMERLAAYLPCGPS